MTIRNAATNLGAKACLPPKLYNAASWSVVFDVGPWRAVIISFTHYTHNTTGGSVTFDLQDSDSSSGPFTDVPGMTSTLVSPLTNTLSGEYWTIQAESVRRFVRVAVNVPASSSCITAASWVGHAPMNQRDPDFDWDLDSAIAIPR